MSYDLRNKAVLISLENNTMEMENLMKSMNYDIWCIFVQERRGPDKKYFVGKGKIEEIKEFVSENQIDIAVVNSELKPSHHYNMESCLGITVLDRIGLILEIFSKRAYRKEAKLQVELAKLEHDMPLLREWIHIAKTGEHPGFMAGGEYDLAYYYQLSRKRMRIIKEKLDKIGRDWAIRRENRRKGGFALVGIAGYTNAGKSVLLNALTDRKVLVENKLFSTLSTTTGKMKDSNGTKVKILLTDTVGFIDELPPYLVQAFRSTLEEVLSADLVILVIDSSDTDEEFVRKLKVSDFVLKGEEKDRKLIVALNKIDLLTSDNITKKTGLTMDIITPDKVLPISAEKNLGLDVLANHIREYTDYPIKLELILDNREDTESFINWLYLNTNVKSVEYGDKIMVETAAREKHISYIKRQEMLHSFSQHI